MAINNKISQGGYVRMYWIVAVALVVVLLLGINFAKQRAEQARKDQLIAALNEKTESERNDSTNSENQSSSTGTENQNVTASGEENNAPIVNSELPKTGPGDLLGVVLLSILFGLSVSYTKSLRALRQSL